MTMLGCRRPVVIATLIAFTASANHPARGQTAPVTPVTVHKTNAELAVLGAVIFTVAWAPALAISVSAGGGCDDQSCRDRIASLKIPVVGPLLAGGGQSDETLLVLWAMAQAAGIAALVVGLLGHDVPVATNKPAVAIVPTLFPDSAGVVLHARF